MNDMTNKTTDNFGIIPRQLPVTHELTVNHHEYQHILYGRETITTKNDRNYHVGDTLVLQSVDPDENTEIVRTITSIEVDNYYVNLGLKR